MSCLGVCQFRYNLKMEIRSLHTHISRRVNVILKKNFLTVPRVSKLLLIEEPSFLRCPVISVLELSDPARSIRCNCERLTSSPSSPFPCGLLSIVKVNIVWLRLLKRLTLFEPTCLCSAITPTKTKYHRTKQNINKRGRAF
jgi:hypothetical protein